MNGNGHFRLGVFVVLGLCVGLEMSAVEPPTQPVGPDQARSISAHVTEVITAALPKYGTPLLPPSSPPRLPDPAVAEEMTDAVFHLPSMQVTTPRAPDFSPYSWLTEKGRLDLALKTFPGLAFVPLAGLNAKLALAMLVEEKQAQATAALADQVERVTIDDTPEARKIKQVLLAALQRPNTEWQTARGGQAGRP